MLNLVSAPLLSRLPQPFVGRVAEGQRPGLPVFGPTPPLEGGPSSLVEAAPLYAGESVARIRDVRTAADLTRELARA
jgi:hypothetical protein